MQKKIITAIICLSAVHASTKAALKEQVEKEKKALQKINGEFSAILSDNELHPNEQVNSNHLNYLQKVYKECPILFSAVAEPYLLRATFRFKVWIAATVVNEGTILQQAIKNKDVVNIWWLSTISFFDKNLLPEVIHWKYDQLHEKFPHPIEDLAKIDDDLFDNNDSLKKKTRIKNPKKGQLKRMIQDNMIKKGGLDKEGKAAIIYKEVNPKLDSLVDKEMAKLSDLVKNYSQKAKQKQRNLALKGLGVIAVIIFIFCVLVYGIYRLLIRKPKEKRKKPRI